MVFFMNIPTDYPARDLRNYILSQ